MSPIMPKEEWDAVKRVHDFHMVHLKAGIEESPNCQICWSFKHPGKVMPTTAKEGSSP